jgi:flagellar motor switch/type III secretory pathway protein FliN
VIAAARVRQFPWTSLESLTREEVRTLRGLRRWLEGGVRVEAFSDSLASVVECEVEVLVRRAQPQARAGGLENGVGVILAPAETSGIHDGVLVACEQALAATLVARSLRRPSPKVPQPGATPSSSVGGAVGAVLLAALRRAHQGLALRVLAAGPARVLEEDLFRVDPTLVAVTATVLVADEAFLARLVVARRLLDGARPAHFDATQLAQTLGPVELRLPLVACAALATVAEVASLRVGDVWVPGNWPLKRGARGALMGGALLAAPASEIGTRVELTEDGRLVLGGTVEPVCVLEGAMGEASEESALIEAVGEVPVIVRVEIGEARMSAREWAAVRQGDVLALGRRIGEPVVLRVGGVEIARGDLVEIEGEVGVRVVERIATMSSAQ